MTSLFLLGETWDESPAVVRALRETRAKDNDAILPLDFWAGKKLRDASISYRTPRDYFDAGRGRDLDGLAARLGQTWYEALGDQLEYDGISLGQVAEYDFTFLFIDALRSVEIARELLRIHDPDRVFVTPQFPRIPSGRPNGICYESLPHVMESLGRERNLAVSWSGTGPPPPPRRRRVFYELLRQRVHAVIERMKPGTARARDSVFFMDTPLNATMSSAIHDADLRGVSLPPQRAGRREVKRQAAVLRRAWEGLQDDTEFHEVLIYNGVPLAEVLAPRFRAFFSTGALELVSYIEGAKRLIRWGRPRLVVLPEDVSPIRRATAKTFRRHGVPVLVIQHGAVSLDMGGFHVMPLEGDRQAVWGDIPRKWHIKRERTSASQVITGNPGFDRIAMGYEPGNGALRRRFGLRPGLSLILVATDWFAGISTAVNIDDEERYIRYTLKALGQLPRYRGIVKLHPNFQGVYARLVQAISEEEGVDVTIAWGNLWDLLALADLVIVSNSTVGLEAMILGKPVVVVETYEGVEMVPYVASGAALGATSPEEIVEAVNTALSDPGVREEMKRSREEFVRGYAHLQDGNASGRVGQLIQEMVRPPQAKR